MTAIRTEFRPEEQAFLQRVYDKFKIEGGWPKVRQLQIELVDMGSIQAVADTIGSEYVRCDHPGDSRVCSLELKGVAVCEGSEGDIENFLATIRYAAQRYVESESRPCISGAILQSALGMTQPDAKRACVLLQRAHGLWRMSSPIGDDVEITVGDDIVHYQGVQSLEEFWGRAERLKQQVIETGRGGTGQPIERTEAIPRRYIADASFRDAYPEAYSKWAQAEDELWSEDRETRLTTVGHLCREAMQVFATSLVKTQNIKDAQNNPANTVARLRVALKASTLAKTDREFLDALVAYWGTVSDLVQRLEHGAQREGTPLQWKDASRLVFQTLAVMYEVDQSLRPD